jgi:hypothetical protein
VKSREKMPVWVRLILMGIRSRKMAIGVYIVMAILSAVLILLGLKFKGYLLLLSFVIPLWYRLSIRWIDKYASWGV